LSLPVSVVLILSGATPSADHSIAAESFTTMQAEDPPRPGRAVGLHDAGAD
jgi:hypothetical protein